MARKAGPIIRGEPQMWVVRINVGRDPETLKPKYIGKSIHGGLRVAQADLPRTLVGAVSGSRPKHPPTPPTLPSPPLSSS
jgi:hypothetical protein